MVIGCPDAVMFNHNLLSWCVTAFRTDFHPPGVRVLCIYVGLCIFVPWGQHIFHLFRDLNRCPITVTIGFLTFASSYFLGCRQPTESPNSQSPIRANGVHVSRSGCIHIKFTPNVLTRVQMITPINSIWRSDSICSFGDVGLSECGIVPVESFCGCRACRSIFAYTHIPTGVPIANGIVLNKIPPKRVNPSGMCGSFTLPIPWPVSACGLSGKRKQMRRPSGLFSWKMGHAPAFPVPGPCPTRARVVHLPYRVRLPETRGPM
jgi:hypothetical protein